VVEFYLGAVQVMKMLSSDAILGRLLSAAFLVVLTLIMISSSGCMQTGEETQAATPTLETPSLSTIFSEGEEAINTMLMSTAQPIRLTQTAMHDLEAGESWHRVSERDVETYEELSLVINYPYDEEYVDDEGQTAERRVTYMWIGSTQRPAAVPRLVRVGQIIIFEGYRIRILAIDQETVDVAISELGEPRPAATPTLSIYNTEPGEIAQPWFIRNVSHYRSIWFEILGVRVEETVDESGVRTEEATGYIQVWSVQEATDSIPIQVGDVIEFEGYRIRILSMDEGGGIVALADLSEIP
jgi:hypothetical protein